MENFGKLIWADELSIGNLGIDNDHKRLIEIYNELVEFIQEERSREQFAYILSKMTDYSLTHFRKEEEYMKQLSYPDLQKHRNYHRDYIYTVAMYNNELSTTGLLDKREIVVYLKKWWVNHIMKVDLKYERFKRDSNSDINY